MASTARHEDILLPWGGVQTEAKLRPENGKMR